ncbi:MAG: copper chaperone PCu(A)C [Bacteriovoracaceae bacterium]|nr:copper chaperone PCu(A)C [Bacteriovoracaceae bacterium]
MKKLLIMILLFPMLASSSGTMTESHITFESQWIKAVPASSKMSAMFGKLTNNTGKDLKLIEVKGTIAKNIEIHTHKKVNGVMKMRKVSSLIIPSKGSLEFKPMHEHIMFIGLKNKLDKSKKYEFTFVFDGGVELKTSATVKKMGGHSHHH